MMLSLFHLDNNLYKLVSATSVVVAANMNKIAAIILAWFVFQKALSVTQLFGLCVCIAGAVSYAIQVKKDKTKSAEAGQTQEMTNKGSTKSGEDV